MKMTSEDWVLQEAKFIRRSRELAIQSCIIMARMIIRFHPQFTMLLAQMKKLSREYNIDLQFFNDRIIVEGVEIKSEDFTCST